LPSLTGVSASTDWTADRFDPHMARFAVKLIAALDA